jgi:hypothetical protein
MTAPVAHAAELLTPPHESKRTNQRKKSEMQPARRFYVSAKQAGGGGGVSARLSCMRRLRCIWARFFAYPL